MRKLSIGIAIITILLMVFLIINHKQPPTKDDVFKTTKNWSPATEEVYFVKKIDGEWLTIFRSTHSIMVAQLQQNWLGYWEIKDDDGREATIASTAYPPLQDVEFSWTSGSNGKTSHYFGQIYNPAIKKIEVETEGNFFEEALILHTGDARFFLTKSSKELKMPVNIRGFSEDGTLIHATMKEGQVN